MYTITGACDVNKFLDGITFLSEGRTKSGAPYFKAIGYEYYIYYDPDCSRSGAGPARWLIDKHRPNTQVDTGLDGNGQCDYFASIDSKDITNPPVKGQWKMDCGGVYKTQYLLFYEYTTTGGPCQGSVGQVTAATTKVLATIATTKLPTATTLAITGPEYDVHRTSSIAPKQEPDVFGIAPCPENSSVSHGAVITTTKRPTVTTIKPVVNKAMPNLILSGACPLRESLNGVTFDFVGRTADGSPYYKARGVEEYIYYDKDCDGTGPVTGARWVLDDSRPSLTLREDLDNDKKCAYHAWVEVPSSASPPDTATWTMECGTASWEKVTLTFKQTDFLLSASAWSAGSVLVAAFVVVLVQSARSFTA